MKRKVILSKEAVLWHTGDSATTFAVLEKGKLGVKTGKGLSGVLWPGMVLGESSILGLLGEPQLRTATVFAMQDETHVTEYPAIVAQQSFDANARVIGREILTTLVGQIARDSLLLIASHKHNPMVSVPFKSLMQGLVRTYKPQIGAISRWDDFIFCFRYLHSTRNYTEAMRDALTITSADKDAIFKASEVTHEFFKDSEDVSLLSEFLNAEKDRSEWMEGKGIGR